MTLPPALQKYLSRFRKLPQSEDVWEGAHVAMPTWVQEAPGGPMHRPVTTVWASTTRRLAHFDDITAGHAPGHGALAALFELGTSSKLAGYRPRAVRVDDPQFAQSVRPILDELGIPIEIVDELPAVHGFVDQLAESLSEDGVPPALSVPGVTVARLRAFADAARQFFEAGPWRHLNDGDLIEIAEPRAGPGLRLCAVMGSAGAEFGVGFFASLEQYEAIMNGASPDEVLDESSEWVISLSPGWEIPPADLAAWDRYALPLASDHAYPVVMRLDAQHEPQRPDAGRLAFFEGLLRALAMTTEAEMDTGRWAHTVTTSEGEQRYTLTLPDLLDPANARRVPDPRSMERMTAEISRTLSRGGFASIEEANAMLDAQVTGRGEREIGSTAASPIERAQDVMYDAFEARGRRQLHLIRQALEVSPDCADAYSLLAQRAGTPADRRSLYEQAVAAGERALGPHAFTDRERSFWSDVETRPYMHARAALAECLAAEKQFDAAVAHLRALMELNPDDNQGLRYRLLTVLVNADRNDEAEMLHTALYEPTAFWLYPAVLLALRAGNKTVARTRLRAAIKANRRVPAYLAGHRDMPEALPSSYAPGDDDEAVICAVDLIDAWHATPDAVAWLRAELRRLR